MEDAAVALAGLVLARDREELRAARDRLGGTVAVVPTMGALHAGHVSLVRRARELCDHVVVTVFVNPLQFGSVADLDTYPRTTDADLALCAAEGVDVVFAPRPDAVYPAGEPSVRVAAGPLARRWEGASRPGHFDGVLTVVTVLLHLVRPDVAVFGRKDRQQLALVEQLVRDLALPVRIEAAATVREPDGLALSSRNVRLGTEARTAATALVRSLRAAELAAGAGAAAPRVLAAARGAVTEPGVEPDYLALVDPVDLEPVPDAHAGPAVVLVAAVVGGVRLIDNADVHLAPR